MNQALELGFVLVVAGALAALGLWTLLRRQADEPGPAAEAGRDKGSSVIASLLGALGLAKQATPGEATPASSPSRPPASETPISPLPSPSGQRLPSPLGLPDEEALPAYVPSMPQSSGQRPRIQIAGLFREEVTGKLIVKVGEREYASPEALRDSPDQQKVESAATELSRWFDVRQVEQRQRETPADEQPAERRSMVEQINAILMRKLAGMPSGNRGISLVEGLHGDVRVYIGLQSYTMDEVPDPEVRRLIQEAVSEWESRS